MASSKSPTPEAGVLLYARLSVSREESVSIERQLQAGRDYAAAHGWPVRGEFVDDGVSATKTRPEDRAGWRALLAEAERARPYAVLGWSIDRFARRLLDFVNQDRALSEFGTGLVVVKESLDLTTDTGRMIAQILSIFAEFEARQIAARVKDARRSLISQGRRAGGRPPYGFRNVDNPSGKGLVLAQDPAEIGAVKRGADMILSGASLYAVTREFDASAPRRPHKNAKHPTWSEASVEAVLRNPALAGLTPHQPGRKPGTPADPWAVLRDEDGLPVVDDSVAVLSLTERRRLLDQLDAAKRPGSRPQQRRGGDDPAPVSIVSRLLTCGSCGGTLARATAGGYRVLRCHNRSCPAKATVTEAPMIKFIVQQALERRGATRLHEVTAYNPADSGELSRIEEALRDATRQLAATDDPDEEDRLLAQIAALKARRAETRTAVVPTTKRLVTPVRGQETWGAEFESALDSDDIATAARLLREQVASVIVNPVGKGARVPPADRTKINFVPLGDSDAA